MGTTIQEILAANTLLGVTDKIIGGLPNYHLPSSLFGGSTTQPVEGNTGFIIRGEGTQRAAKQAIRGSASRPRTVSGLGQRPEVLIHSAEHVEIKVDTLMGLMDTNNGQRAQVARGEVARIQREAATLSQNLRVAAITSAFALGKIYFNGDGELLPSSSGAAITVDYGVPSGNQNQINWDGSGAIIDATWATATTKILKHIEQIKAAAVKKAGRPLAHAIYGSNIMQYLLDNNYTKDLIYRNTRANDAALMTGQVTFPLGGLTWWPGYYGFFADKDGALQTLVGPDTIVFIPEPDPSWYQMQEGFEPVPTEDFGVKADLVALLASCQFRQGIFQYAEGKTDPVSGKLVYGDNFLPAIHVPECVFIADVTP